jgi:hypothetical protein
VAHGIGVVAHGQTSIVCGEWYLNTVASVDNVRVIYTGDINEYNNCCRDAIRYAF